MKLLERLASLLPHTTITINGKPYLTRYYVLLSDRPWSNIYIHHFHTSDQGNELHNHPWAWGLSLVLAGGYVEERAINPYTWERSVVSQARIDASNAERPVEITKRIVKPGTFNFIRKTDFHRTDLRDESRGAWTLFFTGPRKSGWGFLNRYTSEFQDFRLNPEAIP